MELILSGLIEALGKIRHQYEEEGLRFPFGFSLGDGAAINAYRDRTFYSKLSSSVDEYKKHITAYVNQKQNMSKEESEMANKLKQLATDLSSVLIMFATQVKEDIIGTRYTPSDYILNCAMALCYFSKSNNSNYKIDILCVLLYSTLVEFVTTAMTFEKFAISTNA